MCYFETGWNAIQSSPIIIHLQQQQHIALSSVFVTTEMYKNPEGEDCFGDPNVDCKSILIRILQKYGLSFISGLSYSGHFMAGCVTGLCNFRFHTWRRGSSTARRSLDFYEELCCIE
jgi:hypothetical protein